MRVDAQHNVSRITDAAVRLFARDGLDATVTDIAAEAGVGKTTLLRHFPSRAALVGAAFRAELDTLIDTAGRLSASRDAGDALEQWMHRFAEFMVTTPGMAEALRVIVCGGESSCLSIADRLTEVVCVLLDAAAKTGSARVGIAPEDVLRALVGIGLVADRQGDRTMADRLVEMLLGALRRGE